MFDRVLPVLVRNFGAVYSFRWLSLEKGKSTLLDLLAFRKQPMPGFTVSVFAISWSPQANNIIQKATLNGTPLCSERMHRISSFVEQDDALLGVLTVRECITYALRLQ